MPVSHGPGLVIGSSGSWVGNDMVGAPDTGVPFTLVDSSNIAASGENTTAQLTAPAGKTTSDFTTGRIQDDENPTDAINIVINDYTEVEWNFKATNAASAGVQYEFEVFYEDSPLLTYTQIAKWTISSTITVAVGQASETDTSQLITGVKRLAVGQASETETAQSIKAVKSSTIGQASETDTSQAIAKTKRLAVAQATETDSSQLITPKKVVSVLQTSETDSAFAIAIRKTKQVNQSSEADTAQTIAPARIKPVGQSSETDSAQPIVGSLIHVVHQATENDTAQAIA